jgi:hypothetical protein
MQRWLSVLLILGGGAARAADLAILPAEIALDGPRAFQRVLAESREGATFTGDETAKAAFSIDDPAVAAVSPDGVVTPVADGTATLRATVGDRTATAKVTVRGSGKSFPWSFRNHVLPVLTRAGCNSGACHGAAAGKGGLRLTLRGYGPEIDYDVLTRQALGRRIVKTAPAESLFLLKPTAAIEHGGGLKLLPDSADYRVIAEWIAGGMARPGPDDPHLTSITVDPPAVRLSKGQVQDVLVRAAYSDGRVEDVTRWAKFGANDATVATVDDDGRITVQGGGEGVVTVWFNNLVELVTVTSPYPSPIDPERFARAARRNRIDELNLAKLQALGIPPSPGAGDAAFLRRAYLDATGTLPPETEVEAFLGDADPEKRDRLVDRLLESPEFVDYWAYKWSDLLLVSSKKLPAPAMWAFSRWVRQAVERNLPWDEFARQVITARGSSLKNGAANYFVLHRDPIDLTESASMAFLGLSLTCARCHNHPLEKWTQDQYYGLANLFARVKLKDGTASGDVVVSASPEGDILHPRKGVAMAPQPLDGQPLPLEARGDRREAFADWLADPSNPYFDRAIITRVWRNFFGRGLIEPEDDLRATNPPSDPALMDWLVEDFRSHRRDLRHLMRIIMRSAAYARSSEPVPGNEEDARFLSHYVPKRLPAEVLLDAMARVTEVPTPFKDYPEGWRSLQLPDVQVANTFLESFGRPERLATCSCERSSEPSMAQALHLSNGQTLNDKLRSDGGVVKRLIDAKADDATIVATLFRSALSRPPTDAEKARLLPALAEAANVPGDAAAVETARRQAVEDLYWAVLTSNEFLFNH